MVALGQTVTIVNSSGKVVKTSKHLVNVFKEAKSAYRERKAEIKAVRVAELDEKRARHALENLRIEDDNFFANDDRQPARTQRPSNLRHEYDEDDSPDVMNLYAGTLLPPIAIS
ncbi:hypothetical protein H2203_003347 [Taxawa tesnikishii (nom. ined.)]|nr:hypothetical protein H2203_003347 [Dothideales sp. JES 119]